MDFNGVLKQLKDNPELAKSLEDAYRGNAGAEEISGILGDAGMDAEVVDELLAEYQRRRGLVISADDLDEETLRMVAGGDDAESTDAQTGECVKHFKDGTYYYGETWCDYWMWCDDNFCGINTECAATTLNS